MLMQYTMNCLSLHWGPWSNHMDRCLFSWCRFVGLLISIVIYSTLIPVPSPTARRRHQKAWREERSWSHTDCHRITVTSVIRIDNLSSLQMGWFRRFSGRGFISSASCSLSADFSPCIHSSFSSRWICSWSTQINHHCINETTSTTWSVTPLLILLIDSWYLFNSDSSSRRPIDSLSLISFSFPDRLIRLRSFKPQLKPWVNLMQLDKEEVSESRMEEKDYGIRSGSIDDLLSLLLHSLRLSHSWSYPNLFDDNRPFGRSIPPSPLINRFSSGSNSNGRFKCSPCSFLSSLYSCSLWWVWSTREWMLTGKSRRMGYQ